MSAKVEKIKQQLQVYRAELAKYKKLFMEDGVIDNEEQAQLDSMNAVIDECEQKLNAVKNKKKQAPSKVNVENSTEKENATPKRSKKEFVKKLKSLLDKLNAISSIK